MEPLGLEFKVLKEQARTRDLGADATVGLRFGGRQLRYTAEIKHRLRPEMLGPIVHQLRAWPGPGLLVTDYVTPPLADALRDQGIEFIDAAGNAYLNQPPLLVFVKGQRRTDAIPTPERGRAFQATGLQVLFALLAHPELMDRPYREIAAAAGVAHGTVGWVMAELPGKGFVAEVRGRRRLMNGERLLNQWTEACGRTLRPRLLLGKFRGEMKDLQTRAQWPAELLVGGEVAAARITRHLRPETATFYAEAIDPKIVLKLRASLLELPW